MVYAILLFLGVGIAGGFFSGLLGIGGGVVMVPLLSLAFTLLGMAPDQIYRLAVGTSLASIIFTSFASARAHNKYLPLRWDLIKGMAGWLVLGTLAGSTIATRIPPFFLKAFFTLFIFALAAHMLLGLSLGQRKEALSRAFSRAVGVLIGLACSLVGIGGGTMLVPYIHWNCNTMHCAIGVSASLGVCISLAGALGYIINGISQYGLFGEGLPWGALGYVHLPAIAAIMLTATLFAPLGVRLAHKLSARQLKFVFGLVMLAIAFGMTANMARSFL